MPVMGGVQAATAIREEFPNARMIALTTYGGDEDIRRALAAGVQAYLTKDVLHDELLKALRNSGRIDAKGIADGAKMTGLMTSVREMNTHIQPSYL